jgi:uncharacterized membrane protein
LLLKTIILSMYIPMGVLFIAIGVSLIRRRIAPNSLYGFRVRRTLEDPEVWYDANEFTGRCLIWLGIGLSLSGLALYFIPDISPVAYVATCGAILLVGVVVSVLLSFRYLNRITR